MKNEEDQFQFKYVVGIDEVGLGAIAGPIVAVAIMFDKETLQYLRTITYKPKKKTYTIDDSKKLPADVREHFCQIILQMYKAIGYGIVLVNEINTIKSIYQAGIVARSRALFDLLRWSEILPDLVLVDGPPQFEKFLTISSFPQCTVKAIVKGDSTYISIAAASIVAKVFRDNIMKNLAEQFPEYKWEQNVGYRSVAHFEGIKKYGVTEHHRVFLLPTTFLKDKNEISPKNS